MACAHEPRAARPLEQGRAGLRVVSCAELRPHGRRAAGATNGEELAGPLAGMLGKTQKFVEEVQVEMRRVTWPDREQLRNATGVILVFVLILAIIIGVMDTIFSGLIRLIIRTFGG